MTDTALPPQAPNIDPPVRLTSTRTRALLVGSAFFLLIAGLWFTDVLISRVPQQSFQPAPVHTGPYTVQLAATTLHPSTQHLLNLRITIPELARQDAIPATLTYHWNMVIMDMGSRDGTAQRQPDGAFMLQVQGSMGGYWHLTLTIHMIGQPDVTAGFDIPLQQ